MQNAMALLQDRFEEGTVRYASVAETMSFEERYNEFTGRVVRKTDDFIHWVESKIRGMFPPKTGMMGAPEQTSPVTYEELLRTVAASDPGSRGWNALEFGRYPFKYVVEVFERGNFEISDRLARSMAQLRLEWLEKALSGEVRLSRDERDYYRDRMDLYFDYWLGARNFVVSDEDGHGWEDPVSRQIWLFSVGMAVPEYLKSCIETVGNIGPYTVDLVESNGVLFENLCREWW